MPGHLIVRKARPGLGREIWAGDQRLGLNLHKGHGDRSGEDHLSKGIRKKTRNGGPNLLEHTDTVECKAKGLKGMHPRQRVRRIQCCYVTETKGKGGFIRKRVDSHVNVTKKLKELVDPEKIPGSNN